MDHLGVCASLNVFVFLFFVCCVVSFRNLLAFLRDFAKIKIKKKSSETSHKSANDKKLYVNVSKYKKKYKNKKIGAGTVAGPKGERKVTDLEKKVAVTQGKSFAEIVKKLAA